MTTFLQLIVVGLSTGSVFAVVGISPRPHLPDDRNRQVRAGHLRRTRRTPHLKFHQWPAALASREAVAVFLCRGRRRMGASLAVLAFGFSRRTPALASLIITLGASFIAEASLLLAFGDIPRSLSGGSPSTPGTSKTSWCSPSTSSSPASRSSPRSG